jgi:hypothetical protein
MIGNRSHDTAEVARSAVHRLALQVPHGASLPPCQRPPGVPPGASQDPQDRYAWWDDGFSAPNR